MNHYIKPSWPAPNCIHAYTTTRCNGYSQAPYAGFNLADHVGDSPAAIQQNREQLKTELQLPNEPRWMQQIHSNIVISHDLPTTATPADAAYTHNTNVVCTVLTADCLPILLCNKQGTKVAAIHAGWRSLAGNIIENAINAIGDNNLLVWLGPAIGPSAFEVGSDVYQAFTHGDLPAKQAFAKTDNNKWLADIYLLATQKLNKLGIYDIYGGDFCTYTDQQRFYSYRRDGLTGRMASLIWIANPK